MCLVSSNGYFRNAEHVVPCLKMVYERDGRYYTSMRDFDITDAVIGGKELVAEGKKDICMMPSGKLFYDDYIIRPTYEVNGGFIHTYVCIGRSVSDLLGEFKRFDDWCHSNGDKGHMLLCHIPKDVGYFIGKDYDYASESIIVDGDVSEWFHENSYKPMSMDMDEVSESLRHYVFKRYLDNEKKEKACS